jgi:hypothetical protein
MALTFGQQTEERQGWSDVVRAVRRVPPRILQAIAAAAVLGLLAWAVVQAMRPAAWVAPASRAAAAPASDQPDPPRTRCGNCGVVESIRPLPPVQGVPAGYEFTVRLRDGSVRTSTTTGKASWHVGDRILLLGGEAAP